MLVRKYSTGVAITNPLVLYRALLATNRIRPDPAQHRLALHLQKLYERLKDYEPTTEYSHRLHQLSRVVGTNGRAKTSAEENRHVHPRGFWSSLLAQKEKRDSVALTRVLTSHEQAMQLDSPKGLMLHGEVGTGKSMLIDLFADCLPNRKKRRWHFNTFMLDTLAKLETLRRTRSSTFFGNSVFDDEHSLLVLARDMIETSPILFLDEFQLPDRAASKIMSNLLTSFFHLGGVLIATSNRMPEELAKAAGMEFTPPPTRMDSLRWRFGVRARSDHRFAGRGDFAPFLEVLKTRCEVWEMEGGKDYRRSESEAAVHEAERGLETAVDAAMAGDGTSAAKLPSDSQTKDSVPKMASMPKNYFVKPSIEESTSEHKEWLLKLKAAESTASGVTSPEIPWSPSTIRVYGRQVTVPRQYNGVTSWTFSELCARELGPADYITLASTFHTLILTDVPVLTLLQKNEARRFITLLDALYEARCKLLITAARGPDDIFFPESRPAAVAARAASTPSSSSSSSSPSPPQHQQQQDSDNDNDSDAVYSETFSDIYQDATAPFRPNISSYNVDDDPPSREESTPTMLAPDALEDDPPNRVRRGTYTGSFGLDRDYSYHSPSSSSSTTTTTTTNNNNGSSSSSSSSSATTLPPRAAPNFGHATAFTGEDERFAYKRARSRLWEMCGARWWARGHSDDGNNNNRDSNVDSNNASWWTPVAREVRARWEVPVAERAALEQQRQQQQQQKQREVVKADGSGVDVAEGMGAASDVDEVRDGGPATASPFRTFPGPPPKIGWTHVWGTMTWGRRAGAWGKGVEGLEERRKEREREREEEEMEKEKAKEKEEGQK
ncbi:mitochondrial atpase [Diplodia corticola]|uniref:Mitochondrial atpase n=1 Tax=Diplodia corticola TaxID=236234 RepID=A0A1J9QNA6_9PEZI|nr:mitochondrial atpase [Diplodia corticola]OJD29944.1 mitochondrial atpase [Diplodia corticola]